MGSEGCLFFPPPTPARKRASELTLSLSSPHFLQDGKLYIQSLTAGIAESDQRAQGFTVVCRTEFASMDDMKFYDEECKASRELRLLANCLPSMAGFLTVHFHPAVNTFL